MNIIEGEGMKMAAKVIAIVFLIFVLGIAGGRLTDIEILDDVDIPKPEWTKLLFDRIIEKQSTKVDVVSGATVTSKAYIKSIEDALSNNMVRK